VDGFLINSGALVFLSLSGVILLFYMLRLKRRRMEVSSTLLFSQALEEFQANAPFQWLRKNLLLLLQLIVLILIVLALTRPFFIARAQTGGRTVLLIDVSYSMLASDGGKTRLQRAIEKARSFVNSLSVGDQEMIVTLSDRPKVLCGFTPDKMELNRNISLLRDETGGAANFGEAVKLLQPIVKSGARVIVLSDGGFEGVEDSSLPEGVILEFIAIGKRISNAGITTLALSRVPGGDDFELFVSVKSTFEENIRRTIILKAGDLIIDQRTIDLPAEGSSEIVISPLPCIDVPLSLSFAEKDDFPVDDECSVVIPAEQVIPVTLVSEPDILLESALLSDSSLDVVRISPKALDSAYMLERPGVFIFNKTVPLGGVAVPMLVIAPPAPVGGVTPGEFVAGPRIVDWDKNHPLLSFISVPDISFARAYSARLAPGMQVVLDGTEGPLIVSGEESNMRYAVTLFDVAESDFPLRAAFPIFLHNTAVWLSRTASGFDPYNAAVGRPWKFKVERDVVSATLTSPSGKTRILQARGGYVSGIDLNEIGLWSLEAGDQVAKIAVNLLDSDESKLAVSESFKLGSKKIVSQSKARISREIYPWLIVLALLVMLGEWYLYHKRNL